MGFWNLGHGFRVYMLRLQGFRVGAVRGIPPRNASGGPYGFLV